MKTKKTRLLSLVLSVLLLLSACAIYDSELSNLQYEQESYVELSENIPEFSEDEITDESCETYSNLDYLGRCGIAFACIGQDIMPTEERESIGQVKPSGWQLVKYDNVDGKYLYNRCPCD